MSRSNAGRNLVGIREGRMWTQGKLAEEAGVSPTTISGLESGRISAPHFGTIRKLARALEVAPGELLDSRRREDSEAPASLSLAWAVSTPEEEFERELEDASMEGLTGLSRELDEEHGRLRVLYGTFPRKSEERRLIKRRIRDLSAQAGSIQTSIEFHQGEEDFGG